MLNSATGKFAIRLLRFTTLLDPVGLCRLAPEQERKQLLCFHVDRSRLCDESDVFRNRNRDNGYHMYSKGFVRLVVALGCLHLFSIVVFATQLNPGNSSESPNSLGEQHCQTQETSCQEIRPSFLTPDHIQSDLADLSSGTITFEELCCRLKEQESGFFTLDFILNDVYFTGSGFDDWSVMSSLVEEESVRDGLKNEIDLSEVEELEGEIDPGERSGAMIRHYAGEGFDPVESMRYYAPYVGLNTGTQDFSVEFNLRTLVKSALAISDERASRLAELGVVYEIPDIPVYSNKKIEAFIHLYTVKKRDVFLKAIERFPRYQLMIAKTLADHELPLNLIYLAVVESNLNPNARSRANATGLWQFMSYTGKHFGLSRSWWHDDRYDPDKSTVAAAEYLKQLHKQFKGDWELALAAYNSGPGTVRRAIRRATQSGKATDYWSLKLPRETRGYVPAFYAVATIFANLEAYGFDPLRPALEIQPKQQLDVAGGVSLIQLAKLFDLNVTELEEINPRLRLRGLTPPTYASFEVMLPAMLEITQAHLNQVEDLKNNRKEEWKTHHVQQGETLWSISRHYRIPMSEILAYNRLRQKNLLRIGQQLMLPVPVDWNPPKRPSKTSLAILDIDKVPGETKIHVVKKGETLWQISQKYNIPLKKIQHWNRRVLGNKYLKIGTEIVLKLPVSLASTSL